VRISGIEEQGEVFVIQGRLEEAARELSSETIVYFGGVLWVSFYSRGETGRSLGEKTKRKI